MASSAMKLSLFFFLLSSLTHARDSQFFNKIPTTTNNVVVPNNKESTTNQQQQEPNSLPENQNNNQQQQQPNSLPENQNNNQQQEQEPSFLPDTENSYGLYGHESNNNVVVPNNQQQQQPNFLPNDWNSYGQYGHESGQNPPSTTTTAEFKQPDHKYLPKNYNPVAYVTQPDDINEETSFSTNPNNNNGAQNFNNQQQNGEGEAEEDQFRNYPTTTNNNNRDNYYYNGGSSFNSHPQRQFTGGFEPQGMSDTRVVANGKYFYDLNSERFSNNHPYESLRAQNLYDTRNFYVNNADEASNRDFNNRNFYGNNENGFNGEGYQNFQNEENLP